MLFICIQLHILIFVCIMPFQKLFKKIYFNLKLFMKKTSFEPMHCYSLTVRVIIDFDKFTNTTLQSNMLLMIFSFFVSFLCYFSSGSSFSKFLERQTIALKFATILLLGLLVPSYWTELYFFDF